MIGLCGFWASAGGAQPQVIRRMASALRTDSSQPLVQTDEGSLSVGAMDRKTHVRHSPWQARSDDGRHTLWTAGEVFSTRAPLTVAEAPTAPAWQQDVLEGFREFGAGAFSGLNGDFQLAVWDRASATLTLAVDRFCTMPLYWSRSASGFAFAFGVRGVLMAPGIESQPDLEAIREAVTFGGYRLGERTNIANVRMLRPAHVLEVSSAAILTRPYWSWREIPLATAQTLDDAVEELRLRWKRAIARRLSGTDRPGQTLSGGRDSRAILAEAAPQTKQWSAITYGVPGCDDARYAAQAARAVGARWQFAPLYQRTSPDWLARRTSCVQDTDGLIDLIDLMHLEQRQMLTEDIDCHLPGYLGDVIVGTTYDGIASYDGAMLALPFTGASIGLVWNEARERLEASSTWRGAGSGRELIFEHKFPQAIGRPNAAMSSWVGIRRPFLDLDVVDLAFGLPGDIRAGLYDAWALTTYPEVFRRVPLQKSGAPLGTSTLGLNRVRAARVVRRAARRVCAAVGVPLQPWSRTYTADEVECARPRIRQRLEGMILRPSSIVCDLWGSQAVRQVLDAWFEHGQGASQVVGALYSWETYHAHLGAHLRAAQSQADQ